VVLSDAHPLLKVPRYRALMDGDSPRYSALAIAGEIGTAVHFPKSCLRNGPTTKMAGVNHCFLRFAQFWSAFDRMASRQVFEAAWDVV
jgi:hypothetical protein